MACRRKNLKIATTAPSRKAPARPASRRGSTGVTLIELMVVLVVIGVFAAFAVPSFTDQMARRRVEGAANELVTDLNFARTKSVSTSTTVTLASNSLGKQYTVASATETYKTVALDNRLTATASVSVVYTPLRGFAAADTAIDLSSSGTAARLRVSTTVVGKVSVCSPSGGFTGYTSC
jgi:prepilin-type N-terminal cleavage/methylation domain-containing protein